MKIRSILGICTDFTQNKLSLYYVTLVTMVDVCEVDVSMCKTDVGVVTYNSII